MMQPSKRATHCRFDVVNSNCFMSTGECVCLVEIDRNGTINT